MARPNRTWSAMHAPPAPASATTGAVRSWRARRPWKKSCALHARIRRWSQAPDGCIRIHRTGRARPRAQGPDRGRYSQARQTAVARQAIAAHGYPGDRGTGTEAKPAPALHAARLVQLGLGHVDPAVGHAAAIRSTP